jgi:hypothetical protein
VRKTLFHVLLLLILAFSSQHRDTQETLAVLERLDLDTEKPTEEELARKFGYEDAYVKGKVNWWQHLKPKLWSLMDEPYSSNAAKVRAMILPFYLFRFARPTRLEIAFFFRKR